MLTLELVDFLIQLKQGSVQNVGAQTKAATVKLYDVSAATARPFGDNRVKLAFADDEGNEIEVALFPEEAEALVDGLAYVAEQGDVEGFG